MVSVDKELCAQMLASLRQKNADFAGTEAKLVAILEEFASFCETYYLDDSCFKRLRMNIKYAAIIQDADKKVGEVVSGFSDKEYLTIAERLYLDHEAVFKDNYFYYGVILGILDATCKNYDLVGPDFSLLIPVEDESGDVEDRAEAKDIPVVSNLPESETVVVEMAEDENVSEEVSGYEIVKEGPDENAILVVEAETEETIMQEDQEGTEEVLQAGPEAIPVVPEVETIVQEENPQIEEAGQEEESLFPAGEPEVEEEKQAGEEFSEPDSKSVSEEKVAVEGINREQQAGHDPEVPAKKETGIILIIIGIIVVIAGVAWVFLFGLGPVKENVVRVEESKSLPLYYPKIKTDDSEIQKNAFDVSGERVLTDKKLSTVWHVADATGKELVFTLDRSGVPAARVVIYNGAVYKDSEWRNYRRVKAMTLTVNGEPYALLKLEDTKQAQAFDLEIQPNSTLTFKIEEVYEGAANPEMAIAEIMFVGNIAKVVPKPVEKEKKEPVKAASSETRSAKENVENVSAGKNGKMESKVTPMVETTEQKLVKAKELYLDKNYEGAFPLFKQVAGQANAEAQYYLGLHYEKGLGVKSDQFEALVWYRRAAAAGFASASARLKELGY